MGFHHFFCCGQMISGEGSSLEDEFPGIRNVTRYTYRELKRATEDFSHLNKIGEGGFGSVFKGQLRDGTVVAVKELSPESSQGWREFLSELSTLANVRHENLVQIYGFCSEKNHRILVYNYLPNRSLAQTLLGGGYCDLNFDWRTRAKIGVGIAKGLAYLHEEVQPRIVHRDIKASNILLDDDLSPKISDFGLAKLLPSNASHVSTRVAGTIGYLAPEYAIRGQLTRKADIYSFGVLLLEIISGRCNTNTRLPPEDQFLLSRTWEMYEKGDLVSVVDCELNGDFDREEAMRFLKVALLCTQDNPRLRPAMPVVAQILAGERSIKVETITKPGLISEFVDMKIRKEKKEQNGGYSADTISSGASPQDRSLLSAESTVPSSFTAICDRED